MLKIPAFSDLVIFENDHLLVLNKPAGLSSLHERDGETRSLIDLIRRHNPDYQLCHRLDKETSGAIVVAKNADTYRDMAMLFEHRQVKKYYHAVVGGQLNVDHKPILLPIASTKKGIAQISAKEGKPAETIVTTLTLFRHYSLVECQPVTGRLHQIRIHLASQNFPLVGDTTYGGKIPFLSHLKRDFKTSKWENEQGMMQRVALHAQRIAFELNGESIEAIAPYPKDFEVFLKQLTRFDAIQ